MNKEFLSHLENRLQVKIISTEQVFGGDINTTYILQTQDKKIFLKLNTVDHGDMFEKEFAGLDLLRQAKAIAGPEPLVHGSIGGQVYLVMECIEKGSVGVDSWRRFGHQLASLHKNTAKQFGLDHDNYIGSLPQRNKQHDNWAEFYATERVLYMMRMAYDDKKCDSSDTRMAEKFCSKLEVLFPAEKPALLHGDLWGGNFMMNSNGLPVIYDPAVYYGHREMDIGMSLLFGGFDRSFYDHYNEAWPMEKDWRQRLDLAQLYPLLVHLNLFGGHYYQSVRDILKKYS